MKKRSTTLTDRYNVTEQGIAENNGRIDKVLKTGISDVWTLMQARLCLNAVYLREAWKKEMQQQRLQCYRKFS
jgi:hypothetical protein